MTDQARAPKLLDMTDAVKLRQMIMGFRTTQLIYVAARLRLADHLTDGVRHVDNLAQAVGAQPRALYRVMRALASQGIFVELDPGYFQLTPLAEWLRTDVHGSASGLAVLYGADWLWQAYGQMLHSVQTGQPAFDQVHGQPLYDYLRDRPDAGAVFHQAMSAYSRQEALAVRMAYDFTGVKRLVDLGGGHGELLLALLQAYPDMTGVLFDLADVVEDARRQIEQAGMTHRCECVAGDFFVSAPADGQVYLLKSVLHNWDDARCVSILRHCRQAMAPHGRIVVMERVVPPANEAAEAKLFDINMLVVMGGMERTGPEYAALFEAAGLQLTRIIPTQSPLSLIEAAPAVSG